MLYFQYVGKKRRALVRLIIRLWITAYWL